MWHFSGLVPWNQFWVKVCKASTQNPVRSKELEMLVNWKLGDLLIAPFATSLLLHWVVWHLCLGICCWIGLRIFPDFTDACFLWNRPDMEMLKHYKLYGLSSKTQKYMETLWVQIVVWFSREQTLFHTRTKHCFPLSPVFVISDVPKCTLVYN